MTLLIILGVAIAWMLFGWILVFIVCCISENINNEVRHDPTFAIILALVWPLMVVMVSGQLIAEHFNPATLASNMKKRREEKAEAKKHHIIIKGNGEEDG